MKILVISADYPSPDYLYGDVFVHTRLKKYKREAGVVVVGYNNGLTQERKYEYEGISVYITNKLELFYGAIIAYQPNVIIGHLIQHVYIDFLIQLKKPLIIFIHGFEATSWRRRLMNYNSFGALRYLFPYAKANLQQLTKLRRLVQYSNLSSSVPVQFVFVSNWLKTATERDISCKMVNSHVIPNGIDTQLFEYRKKESDLRKKILLIRSFKARNYANDLAIETILKLSEKTFFADIEFAIYGEGYLFKSLTDKIKHLPNVKLYNFFVENHKIPSIHNDYGIFLCPSRMDTQGVSMCEAMASGLVPITNPIGGIPEYAENEVSSFQVLNADELSQKIEYLYYHPEVFQQMSANARAAIELKCSLNSTIPKEMDLIRSTKEQPQPVRLEYKQCSNCILDTADDPSITFDEYGICSFCRKYAENKSKNVKEGEEAKRELEKVIAKIKTTGKGKTYDCILGLSGGVDSTYLAYKARQWGLRPLAVHFDNGWNSELAVNNIENIVTKLGLDLHTHVIDWEEFREFQLAFLKASVVDIEVITDHAIMASLYKIAIENKIKFILSGDNYVTESILPASWIHDKRDHIHIRAINDLFGTQKLKKFPLMNSFLKLRVEWEGIKSVALLNYLPYIKTEIKQLITSELDWRDYGGKHYESVFTRFYQGYILPVKFGIDKRKAHLSNLICSNQLTREEALVEMSKPYYPEELRKRDYEFVLKKLNLSENEFSAIMKLPVKKHSDYPVDSDIYNRFPLLRFFGPVWRIMKRVKRA